MNWMKAQIIKTVYIEVARRLKDEKAGFEFYTGSSYRVDLVAEGPVSDTLGG